MSWFNIFIYNSHSGTHDIRECLLFQACFNHTYKSPFILKYVDNSHSWYKYDMVSRYVTVSFTRVGPAIILTSLHLQP